MNDPVFLGINQNFIAEQIWHAEKSVFLAIPGITNNKELGIKVPLL